MVLTWEQRTTDVQAAITSLELQVTELANDAPPTEEAIEGIRRIQAALDAAIRQVDNAENERVSAGMLATVADAARSLDAIITQQRQSVKTNGVPFNWDTLNPDPLLDALARLPEPLPAASAARLREATSGLSARIAARLEELESHEKTITEEWARGLEDLKQSSDLWKTDLESHIAQLTSRVTESEKTLQSQLGRIETTLASYETQFKAEEAARKTAFDETTSGAATNLNEALARAQNDTSLLLAEIQRMRQEAAKLLGAIGRDGACQPY